MNNNLILSVTALNRYVRSLMEDDPNLTYIFVVGEISNFKAHYSSGHMYFSLKDDGGVIRSVMFRSSAERLKWTPENGMKVICRGRVSLYEKDGQYQLYVDDMQPDGRGGLSLAVEQLRKKLAAEGLFDEENKQPLPRYPQEIAVVTSDTGAAVKDILSILARRYPLASVIMCPVPVQGEGAAAQIADTLSRLARLERSDIIILGRGGGSAEDLWAFNEEVLVRAVAASPIPVISAVGHETDYTLCDLAADFRAPTPSAAAELAVPDASALRAGLYSMKNRLNAAALSNLAECDCRLLSCRNHPAMRSPLFMVEQLIQRLDASEEKLQSSFSNKISALNHRLSAAAGALNALSPLAVLSRGYSLVYKDKKLITAAANADPGDKIEITLASGLLGCTVDRTEE